MLAAYRWRLASIGARVAPRAIAGRMTTTTAATEAARVTATIGTATAATRCQSTTSAEGQNVDDQQPEGQPNPVHRTAPRAPRLRAEPLTPRDVEALRAFAKKFAHNTGASNSATVTSDEVAAEDLDDLNNDPAAGRPAAASKSIEPLPRIDSSETAVTLDLMLEVIEATGAALAPGVAVVDPRVPVLQFDCVRWFDTASATLEVEQIPKVLAALRHARAAASANRARANVLARMMKFDTNATRVFLVLEAARVLPELREMQPEVYSRFLDTCFATMWRDRNFAFFHMIPVLAEMTRFHQYILSPNASFGTWKRRYSQTFLRWMAGAQVMRVRDADRLGAPMRVCDYELLDEFFGRVGLDEVRRELALVITIIATRLPHMLVLEPVQLPQPVDARDDAAPPDSGGETGGNVLGNKPGDRAPNVAASGTDVPDHTHAESVPVGGELMAVVRGVAERDTRHLDAFGIDGRLLGLRGFDSLTHGVGDLELSFLLSAMVARLQPLPATTGDTSLTQPVGVDGLRWLCQRLLALNLDCFTSPTTSAGRPTGDEPLMSATDTTAVTAAGATSDTPVGGAVNSSPDGASNDAMDDLEVGDELMSSDSPTVADMSSAQVLMAHILARIEEPETARSLTSADLVAFAPALARSPSSAAKVLDGLVDPAATSDAQKARFRELVSETKGNNLYAASNLLRFLSAVFVADNAPVSNDVLERRKQVVTGILSRIPLQSLEGIASVLNNIELRLRCGHSKFSKSLLDVFSHWMPQVSSKSEQVTVSHIHRIASLPMSIVAGTGLLRAAIEAIESNDKIDRRLALTTLMTLGRRMVVLKIKPSVMHIRALDAIVSDHLEGREEPKTTIDRLRLIIRVRGFTRIRNCPTIVDRLDAKDPVFEEVFSARPRRQPETSSSTAPKPTESSESSPAAGSTSPDDGIATAQCAGGSDATSIHVDVAVEATTAAEGGRGQAAPEAPSERESTAHGDGAAAVSAPATTSISDAAPAADPSTGGERTEVETDGGSLTTPAAAADDDKDDSFSAAPELPPDIEAYCTRARAGGTLTNAEALRVHAYMLGLRSVSGEQMRPAMLTNIAHMLASIPQALRGEFTTCALSKCYFEPQDVGVAIFQDTVSDSKRRRASDFSVFIINVLMTKTRACDVPLDSVDTVALAARIRALPAVRNSTTMWARASNGGSATVAVSPLSVAIALVLADGAALFDPVEIVEMAHHLRKQRDAILKRGIGISTDGTEEGQPQLGGADGPAIAEDEPTVVGATPIPSGSASPSDVEGLAAGAATTTSPATVDEDVSTDAASLDSDSDGFESMAAHAKRAADLREQLLQRRETDLKVVDDAIATIRGELEQRQSLSARGITARLHLLSHDFACMLIGKIVGTCSYEDLLSLLRVVASDGFAMPPAPLRQALADAVVKHVTDRTVEDANQVVPVLSKLADAEIRHLRPEPAEEEEMASSSAADIVDAATAVDDDADAVRAPVDLTTDFGDSDAIFATALRRVLRVDTLTDKTALMQFLARRLAAAATIVPYVERAVLSMAVSWDLETVLAFVGRLRAKRLLTVPIATALWTRGVGLAFADGSRMTPVTIVGGAPRDSSSGGRGGRGGSISPGSRSESRRVLALATAFADAGALDGGRGSELAAKVVESLQALFDTQSSNQLDSANDELRRSANGVLVPDSMLQRRYSAFLDRNASTRVDELFNTREVTPPSELLGLIALYCHDPSGGGTIDGYTDLVTAYVRVVRCVAKSSAAATSPDHQVERNRAYDASGAAKGPKGGTHAALDDADFSRLLQSLSRAGEWPPAAREYVIERLGSSSELMDGRALCLNVRAICKDPAMRDMFAKPLVERLIDVIPSLDLDDASIAAIGVMELDSDADENVLVAHDMLCQRFVELIGELAAGGEKARRVPVSRFVEAVAVHGADDEMLGVLQTQLKRQQLEARHAAAALQCLAKLYRPGVVDPELFMRLLGMVDSEGNGGACAQAIVAAAQLPLPLTDRLERMFVRVMHSRDVYINNPALRQQLDEAARTYYPRLPTAVVHAFIRNAAHRSTQDPMWASLSD